MMIVILFIGILLGIMITDYSNKFKDISLNLYIDDEWSGSMGFQNKKIMYEYLKDTGYFWELSSDEYHCFKSIKLKVK